MINLTTKLRCNPVLFIIISALFFTIFQNSLFFSKAGNLVSADSVHSYLFLASMPLLLFCLLNIIFSLLLWPFIRKPIIIILLLSGAIINYFMYSFSIVIDGNMIENALQTDTNETMDLLTFGMASWLLLIGIIPALLVVITKISSSKAWYYLLGLRLLNIVVSGMIILIITFGFFKDYASLFRNNKTLVGVLVPSNMLVSMGKVASNRLEASRPYIQLGLDAKKGDRITNQPKKTLVVLVVGETARAENFSLGGYSRNTNPNLTERNNLVYFDNVTSCGTATAVSVPCMFSNMTRTQYSATQARHQDGVLDIIARTGVNVLWRENDGGCKGVCDRVPTQDMTSLYLPQYCKDKACLDEILLYNLDEYINGLDGDGLIVLHQMGSHGPTYYRRYTEDQRLFYPTCDTKQIQDCDTQKLVNTYDNTVVYTDMLLDKTITLLEKYSDQYATAMIYLSDHGESLGENGMYLHGAPYAIAPSQQTHIPMLMWLSPDYQRSYAIDEGCLRQAAKSGQFSQDNLFHSLLGVLDVQTSEYDKTMDILQQCRQ